MTYFYTYTLFFCSAEATKCAKKYMVISNEIQTIVNEWGGGGYAFSERKLI